MSLTVAPLIENDTFLSPMNKQDNSRILHLAMLHMSTLADNEGALFCFKAMKGRCIYQFDSNNPRWQEKLLTNIENGLEVFLTVNMTDGAGTKTGNVKAVRALFLDLDDTTQDNLGIIEAMPLAPNLVVNSSKGKFHCYWRVGDCPLDQFTKLQKALAAKYNGDPSVSDLPRIMRLAGSFNFKNEPQQVTVISHQDEGYNTDEIITSFGFDSFVSDHIGDIQKKNDAIQVRHKKTEEDHKRNIHNGNYFHASILSLAGIWANQGNTQSSIIAQLKSLMESSIAVRDNRYKDRFDDIPNSVKYVFDNNRLPILKEQPANKIYWSDPHPLISELKAVQPLDVKLLPKVMQDLVIDSAMRMQCPPDFLAAALIVASSSIIARRIAVQPKKHDIGWVVYLNLFGNIVGKPSLLKSPTLSIAMAALEKLEAKSREFFAVETKEHIADCEIVDVRAKFNKKEINSLIGKGDTSQAKAMLLADQVDDDVEPTQARYIINDGTIEKIADLLCTNTKGLLIFRDELSGWFNNLNKPDKTNDRSFILESWNGDKPYTIDRIGRGTTFIPTNRLSILGGIQPDAYRKIVDETVKGSQGGDGLLQRFQIAVYPDVSKTNNFVDQAPNKATMYAFNDAIESLSTWSDERDDNLVLKFNDPSYDLFKSWYIKNEALTKSDDLSSALESHYAKYRSLVPTVAAIFYVIDNDTFEGSPYIDEQCTANAIAYVEYLRTHAERIYSLPEQQVIKNAKLILKRFDRLPEPFVIRDIYRKRWAGLTSIESVEPALALLEDYGYCKELELPYRGTGRPTIYYVKHPDYQLPKLTEVPAIQQNDKLSEVNHA